MRINMEDVYEEYRECEKATNSLKNEMKVL